MEMQPQLETIVRRIGQTVRGKADQIRFHPGPVFSQVRLVGDINHATTRIPGGSPLQASSPSF
jgi:hypothetical protein